MSWGLIQEYLEMLPVLEAEEALNQATAIAAGSGTLKDPKSILNQWQKQAQRHRSTPPKKMTKEQLKITALAMGLQVEER